MSLFGKLEDYMVVCQLIEMTHFFDVPLAEFPG